MPVDPNRDQKEVINRFMFINNNRIKIVNEEGFEKVIDITRLDNRSVLNQPKKYLFKEIEFNKIPLFDQVLQDTDSKDQYKDYKEYVDSHFYSMREVLSQSSTITRLKRKY